MAVECGGRKIGRDYPVFLIAEIANAHEGSPEVAEQMVAAAADAGVDAVKFQVFSVDELAAPGHPEFAKFESLAIAQDAWEKIFSVARGRGLVVLADVFGLASLDFAVQAGVAGLKIHSSDICNTILLRSAATSGLPVFLSVGGSTELEIDQAVAVLGGATAPIILMSGFQAFPTELEDTHLARVRRLGSRGAFPVGFMDHSDASTPAARLLPLMALGAGAMVIEKHLTLDRELKGTDYYSSANPAELRELVKTVRSLEGALGSEQALYSQAEQGYRFRMKKVPVAAEGLPAGVALTEEMVVYKRAAGGAFSMPVGRLVGNETRRPIDKDETLTMDKFATKVVILIAVRMKSARLPGKALAKIGEQTLIEHLIDRMKQATKPAAVVVCTSEHPDDKVLADVAAKKGVKSFVGSEDDVMERFLKAADIEQADTIVRVTGDNPLTDPRHIDKMVEFHLARNADYTYVTGLPEGTRAEVVSMYTLRAAHQLAEDPANSEYMTWYLNRPDFFNVQEMPVDQRFNIQARLTVDHPEDLQLMREIFGRLNRPGGTFGLEEVVELFAAAPDLAKINSGLSPRAAEVNTRLRSSGLA